MILLLAIIYSSTFFMGPSLNGDDFWYTTLAYQALHGTFALGAQSIDPVLSIRLMMVYPIALFYLVLGYSPLSSSMWDLLCYLATIVITFTLGRELYGYRVAVLAAALLAFTPLVLMYATTPSPDIPMMMFSSFAVLALVLARKTESRLWYLSSGVSLVLGILTTPEAFITAFMIIAYILIERVRHGKTKKAEQYLIYGATASLFILFALNYAMSGNPLITFSFNYNFYRNVTINSPFTLSNVSLSFYPNTLFQYNLLHSVNSIILAPSSAKNVLSSLAYAIGYRITTTWLLFYALALSMAYLAIRREKRALLPALWFAFLMLYLMFGPQGIALNPFTYIFVAHLDRYLLLVTVPSALLISIAAARALDQGMPALAHRARYNITIVLVVALIVFLLAASIHTGMLWYYSWDYSRYSQLAIVSYLGALPSNTPILYEYNFFYVPLYLGFKNYSRFHPYLGGSINCTTDPSVSYIAVPQNLPGGIDPASCPSWHQVLNGSSVGAPKIPLPAG